MDVLLAILASLSLVLLGWLAWRAGRPPAPPDLAPVLARLEAAERTAERTERGLREELAQARAAAGDEARKAREEAAAALRAQQELLLTSLRETNRALGDQLEALSRRVAGFGAVQEESAKGLRAELMAAQREAATQVGTRLGELGQVQKQQLDSFARQVGQLTEITTQRLEALRQAVEQRLGELQQLNTKKLEEMRATVDEKLQGTLERRLGESFRLVSERLEQVHKGLGEMQMVASGVGDLKRVLTNVKTRGTWGEIQLGNLLEQVLAPEQFARNVTTRPGAGERVEFAIRLPGREEAGPVWLPVDSKFPSEDYLRLVEAADQADAAGLEAAGKALETRVRQSAKEIQARYVAPPHTTDFAVMFLPSEGLYAEVLRRPGLAEALQSDHRVVVAGPTTFAALLNSLQLGFRTLAVEKRSSEVWQVLGAVKTEFGKFGEVLDKVQKKLEEARSQIDQTGVRSRAINRKLRDVEALPATEAAQLLGENEPAEDG